MNFSVFTCLTSFLIAAILVSSLNRYINRDLQRISYRHGAFPAMLFLPFIRLFLPVEFPFTHVVASDTVYPVIYDILASRVELAAGYSLSIATVFMAVWLSGAVFFLSREILLYRRFTGAFRHIPPLCDTRETRRVQHILTARGYGKRRAAVIRTGCVQEPMAYGIVHPVIVLPDQHLDDAELEHILSHELGHYLHGDLWYKWFLEGICALYWWFPAIRKLKMHIYYIMEIRADYFAVRDGGKQACARYMETLLKICRRKKQTAAKTPMSMPLFTYGDAAMIKHRFRAISNMGRQNSKGRRLAAITIGACAMLLLSYTFVLQPRYDTPPTDVDAFTIDASFYWMANVDSGYDLYSAEGRHMGWAPEIQGELCQLPVYYSK